MDLLDIPMPYSAVAEVDPELERNELLWEEGHRNYSGSLGDVRLSVPEGVASAIVSWDGPKELTVELKNTSTPKETIATIPAGRGASLHDNPRHPRTTRGIHLPGLPTPIRHHRHRHNHHHPDQPTHVARRAVV